jgi:hypothetical protein
MSDYEDAEVAILPPNEDGNITEELEINDNELDEVIPGECS